MNLADCFAKMLDHWHLDIGIGELMVVSLEDEYPGDSVGLYNNAMGISKDEGRFLYTLIRYFKPEHVVELGCASGVSTTHMLAALEKNDKGDLTSYDINPGAGELIPHALRKRWTLKVQDINKIEAIVSADFVFEDADHSYETTLRGLELAYTAVAGVIISHDYYLQYGVREAWRTFFTVQPYVPFLFDNTNTGMAGVYFIDDQA